MMGSKSGLRSDPTPDVLGMGDGPLEPSLHHLQMRSDFTQFWQLGKFLSHRLRRCLE